MEKQENFIKVDVMNVEQIRFPSSIFVGKIKFKDLLSIYKYTYRKESDYDPYNEVGIPKHSKKTKDEEFQRQLNKGRLKDIREYIDLNFDVLKSKGKKGKAVGLFPTTIILALDHNFEYNPKDLEQKEFLEGIYHQNPGLDSCFLSAYEKKLFIPKKENIALIVDGQHRFFGLKSYYDSLNKKNKEFIEEHFEFLTTFLIGLDPYEVGEIFAGVNFSQKPVNKSIYFDIFGSFYDDRYIDIKLAHDLALHLNNNEKSSMKGMIKMLGKAPGLISQAFFVKEMQRLFKGGWKDVFEDYTNNGEEYKKIPIFMKVYLSCMEEVYNYAWPKPCGEKDNKPRYQPLKYYWILCKTTGFGTFFRLINDIYPLVKDKSISEMRKEIKNIFNRLTEKQGKKIFSKDGDYGKTGGEGMVSKFYRFLKLKLDLNN